MGKTKKLKKGHTPSKIHKTAENNKFSRISQQPNGDQEKTVMANPILDFEGPWWNGEW
jgi:hypothetical protein